MTYGELISGLRPMLGHGTTYLLLADALRGFVLDGRLVIGERVPSERALATQLQISRTTVSAAYERLRSDGYLTSRHGAGTTVALPAEEVDRPDEASANWPVDIDLTVGALSAPALLGPLAMEAVGRLPRQLAGHGLHPFGLPDLRAAVARRFTERGLKTRSTQVLITQGALHSWDLALRALCAPGDPVLIEQPTYPAAIDAVRVHRGRPVPLAVEATGWGSTARRGRTPVLAHVVPDHHNPTGHHATSTERRALSRALGQTVVVVDETFADLTVDGPETTPFATVAARRPAMSIGSLSKSVWSGLRVGWIRAEPEVLQRLVAARTSQDSASPVFEQLLAVAVFDHYSTLLDERRTMLRHRRNHLVAALHGACPDWTFTVPSGGVALWVDLGSRSSTRLTLAARREGVRTTPGARFTLAGTHDRFLRIPFTHAEPVLSDAVRRLARAAGRQNATLAGQEPVTWTA